MHEDRTVSKGRAKWLALLAVCLAAAAMPLTFTGTAVALPSIGRSLGGGPVALAWVTNAFMLAFGSTLMAAGALADGYGRKRIFLAGAGGFCVFSLGLLVVPNILLFDLLRAGQGLAAAAALSGGMAMLAQVFEGPSRFRAFGAVGTSFGVGLSLGPVSAGLMIAAFGWHSIFLAVVTFSGAAFVIGALVLEESRDPEAQGLDVPGAVGFTLALGLFTWGILLAPERGWGDAAVVTLLAVAALVFALFVVIEGRVARPMLDLSLFRYPRFVGVQLLAAAPAYGFVVLLILLPLRFIGIEGRGEVAAGTLMIALTAPLLVLPLVAGLLTGRLRPATICGVGLLVSAVGLLWLGRLPIGAPTWATAVAMATIGVGIALPWGLMDGLAVSVVPKERAGMAAGIFSTTRVAGEGVALAVVFAVLSTLIAGRLDATNPAGDVGLAAQRLAAGDVVQALSALPGADRAGLVALYGDAFSALLLLLTGITLVTALVVFLALGRGGEVVPAEEDGAMPVLPEDAPELCGEVS